MWSNMWYPLTLISYMLDSQIYGLQPWGFHLTNVLLHAATAVILFLILRRTTGNLWASAFVAFLFAIHPLRVEAVAWVGERKSPLSGSFSYRPSPRMSLMPVVHSRWCGIWS